MRSGKLWFWLAQLFGVAATAALLWGSEIPLGVPGEWVWDRIEFTREALTESGWGWGIVALATVVYLVVCLAGDRRSLEASRPEISGWLVGLVLIGATWHGLVQECPPEPHRLTKVPWVLWYPGTQGYFHEARYQIADVGGYLAKYEERMKEGDVLHFGTHPPGLILLHRVVINVVNRSPKLQSWLLRYQPDSVRESLNILATNAADSKTPVRDEDRAALWLMGLLTSLAAMSTVVPLFCLLRRTCGRETSWRVVCLWPLLPALAVFYPVSDLWMPFFGTWFLAVWSHAWSQRSVVMSLLAGVVMWLGLTLSLALLPVAFLAALWTLADAAFAESAEPFGRRTKHLTACVSSALGAFVGLTLLVRWAWSLDLFAVWMQNFHNHAGFYDKYSRTMSRWLLVNPLELAMAAGLPVFIAALSSWLISMKGCLKSGRSLASFRLWCFVSICVLWLSGKNSGEAARLWIFLLPWLLWVCGREPQVTAKIINAPGQTLPEYAGSPARGWVTLLLLQAIVCVATVSRVDGFHFKTTVPVDSAPSTAVP